MADVAKIKTNFTPGPWVAGWVVPSSGFGCKAYASVVTRPGHSYFLTNFHKIQYPITGNGYHMSCAYKEDEAEPCEEQKKCINNIHPDAHLMAAAPELFAYAHAEENSHTLWQMGEYAYRNEIPLADYWAAVDGLFPEIAAKCPEPTEQAARDWFEADFTTTLDARNKMYGSDADISGDEGSFCSLLAEHLMELRAAALAKALGQPRQAQEEAS